MSSSKGLWMWVKLLLTSTTARQLTHWRTLTELLSLNCAFFWLELVCVSLPIHYSVYEQQQRVVNVSETVLDIYNCKATHSLVSFDWTAFFKLYLFWLELMCVSLPIHWSVHEQQQKVRMWVKLLLTSIIARQLTHSCPLTELLSLNCTFSDWSLCACPFPSIDLCMSSSKGLWMWVKLLSTSTIARQPTHSCTLIELLSLNCAFFSPELMRMSLLIYWSVYEQQQCVVNVNETVVNIYNCKATHSLVYFDWTVFLKLCLFLSQTCRNSGESISAIVTTTERNSWLP